MHPIVHHPVVTQLSGLFDDSDLAKWLASTLATLSLHEEVCLRVDAVVCTSSSIRSNATTAGERSLSLVGYEAPQLKNLVG